MEKADARNEATEANPAKRKRRGRDPNRPRGPTITLHLKVRPEAYPWLEQAGREVNQVWNYSNATRFQGVRPFYGKPRFLSAVQLDKLIAGCGDQFDRIGSDIAQRVNQELVTRSVQFKKAKLLFRCSGGRRRALGWIPFKAANLRVKGDRLRFMGKTLRLFQMDRFLEHRNLQESKLGDGNFAQNALGEWFLNVPVELPIGSTVLPIAPRELVGIDPGLKAVITTSDGDRFEPNRSYRDLEAKIAQAQRRGHKKQAKRLHARARNLRQNHVHQISHRLIAQYQILKLGDVASAFLAAGTKAKSALDGGWGMLKAQLHAKGHRAGRTVMNVSEAYSSQTCSDCGARSGPVGREGLNVRLWTCGSCGSPHDRDVNAAKNLSQVAPRCESELVSKEVSLAGRPLAGTR